MEDVHDVFGNELDLNVVPSLVLSSSITLLSKLEVAIRRGQIIHRDIAMQLADRCAEQPLRRFEPAPLMVSSLGKIRRMWNLHKPLNESGVKIIHWEYPLV